jgi:outer membrane lipoprotein-sorting protein
MIKKCTVFDRVFLQSLRRCLDLVAMFALIRYSVVVDFRVTTRGTMQDKMKTTAVQLARVGAMAIATAFASIAAQAADEPAAPATPAPAAGAATGPAWPATVATANGTSGIALDERQTELVKKVSGYFATLENMKGSFIQTGADKKRMKGKFFVKRPGRFRFDYSLPSKQIIISDGQNLAVQDLDINTEDRVSLDQTAFRLLLRKDVDLIRDAKIIDVQNADDLIVVALQDKSPDAPGRIRLFFATKPDLELKEWVTTDAQGLDTRVEVSDLNKTEQLDAKIFEIKPVGMLKSTP